MTGAADWEGSASAGRSRVGPILLGVVIVVLAGLALRSGPAEVELPGQAPGELPLLPAIEEPPIPQPAALVSTGGTWELLPPAPVSAPTTAEAVWIGAELLVVGGDGEVAAYSSRDARWRDLPPYPGRVVDGEHVHGMVWTGTEVLALAKPLDAPLSGQPVHALDPATGVWRRLPDGPVSVLPPAVSVWTGSDLIIWGRPAGSRVRENDPAVGAAWSEEEGWRVLRRAPSPRIADAAGVLTSGGLVVWGRLAPGGAPSAQPDGGRVPPSGLPEPETYSARWDPGTGEWTALEPPPLADPAGAAAVWTGACGPDGQPRCQQLLLWGSAPARHAAWGSTTGGGASGGAETGAVAAGAALDLRLEAWTPLPDVPGLELGTEMLSGLGGAWTGARMLIVGGGPHSTALSLEGGGRDWRALPGWIMRRGPAVVWTGAELLVWGGSQPDGPTAQLGAWRPD